jgi:ribosomal protein S12 methylthiotransferase
MKKVYLLSLGCPRNLLDSEVLLGLLEQKGFLISEGPEGADVAIVNTCGFIQDAKTESIESILQLVELKKAGKISKLVVTGCLSQRYPSEIIEEITEIDAIFGTADLPRIPDMLDVVFAGEKLRVISDKPAFLYDDSYARKIMTAGHSVYLKIQDGCSNKCSYCVIPALKGPHRSRTTGSVIKEAEALKAKGVKELLVIGQDTTSYGMERGAKNELPKLLSKLSEIMKDGWVRLLYTHPANFPDELIDVIASSPNICKYVDLPIQHVNDRILKEMNRRTTRLEMEDLIGRIRSRIKGVTIRTSVIVGFPGETDEEFGEMMDFIRLTKFERLGAFMFSREEGTKAYSLKGQVPRGIKVARLDELMLLQQRISGENNLKHLGTVRRTIIDEKDEDSGLFVGRTEMDAPDVDGVVYVRGEGAKPGEFCDVKITGTMEYDLSGETV